MINLKKWLIGMSFLILLIGILLHFIYEWGNHFIFFSIIGTVNESVWEHLKILYWPIIIITLIEYFCFRKKYPNFFVARLISLLLGLVTIVVLHYTYVGIFGDHYFLVDMLIYILSIGLSQYIYYRILTHSKLFSYNASLISLVILVVIAILFIVFTFVPPKIPFFMDPTTKTYGI